MQLSIFKLALVMSLMSLSTFPLAAQTVQIGGDITPNAVICLNNSTGVSVGAQTQGEIADCSTLPKTQGDALSIILSGLASTSGGGTGECTSVPEVEPADPSQFEADETLPPPPNGCLLFEGTVSGPLNPDGSNGPNTDIDGILVRATGIPAVRLSFNAPAEHAVLPLDSQNNLLANCAQAPQTLDNCQFAIPGDFAIIIASLATGPYRLEIRALPGVATNQLRTSFRKGLSSSSAFRAVLFGE